MGMQIDTERELRTAQVEYFKNNPYDGSYSFKVKDTLGPELQERFEKNSESILPEALKLITEDRQESYGPPEKNLSDIGKMWAVVLDVEHIPASKVALCMAALKIAREKFKHKRDNNLDCVAYIELANQLAEKGV